MYDNQSLSHTMWECKYHIVWILKYRRRQTISGDLRKHLGGIDHEARMAVVADGHGEIEEDEEEIQREEEQFDLVQAFDSFAHETEQLHGGGGRVACGRDDIEQGQGEEDCRGGQKACGHGPVAQGLHGRRISRLFPISSRTQAALVLALRAS